MIDEEWKKERHESFVLYLIQEDAIIDATVENLALVSVLVKYLIEDLAMKYSGKELEDILNDDVKMLDRYIAYLETRLEIGNFLPAN